MAHTVPIKIFCGGSTSDLRTHDNSPVRTPNAGTTLNVLDDCLISGFGQVILSSLTINSSGIATATSTGHGYTKVGTVILIAGADQEAINGEWIITEITDADNLKFDASDSGLTSTTITGLSITMKVAPLGWSKVFSDAPNYVAVYQSLDPFSRRHFLRVDDSDSLAYNGIGNTYFRGYEFMSSAADQGTYPFPLRSVLSRGILARKGIYTDTGIYFPVNGSNISWVLIGTSRQFYFNYQVVDGADARYRNSFFFGDLVSYVPGDVGATGISGEISNTAGHDGTYCFTQLMTYLYNFCPRNSKKTHTTTSQRFKLLNYPGQTASASICGSTAFIEPDIYSNKMLIYRPFLIVDEEAATYIRGEMPRNGRVLG